MAWSPGPSSGVGEAEDRLLRAGEDQDVVGLEAVVQRGDLAPEERMAGRLRVAEGQAVPQAARLVVGEREELGHRVALDVGGAQQVLDRELPAGEIALEGEVGDAHRRHDADGRCAARRYAGAVTERDHRDRRLPDRARRPFRRHGARPRPCCAAWACATGSRPGRASPA